MDVCLHRKRKYWFDRHSDWQWNYINEMSWFDVSLSGEMRESMDICLTKTILN